MDAAATEGVTEGGESGEGLPGGTTKKTVAANPFAALGADGDDDEDDAEENEDEDKVEGEKPTDGVANDSFRKQGGRGGNGGGGKGKQPYYLNSSKYQ